MRKAVLMIAALLLAGCGADWFPAPSNPNTPAGPEVQKVEVAGKFMGYERNPVTREWYTTTGIGVFRMYTSTPFVANEQLVLETTSKSSIVVKRVLVGTLRQYEVKI